ncbi:hypothetical protein TEA_004190 [Camellia sinensis var. sinensis]|uniref:Rx N-terminal domain-containing protein n=1 Tax=Camellia sinensis var. sinensis TaxID=542762 RepID=A0A4S4D3C2_CAMSN|nr:hypothetical protein TEA_004190 [Camellia sinensis var. sinensis]
MAEYAVLHLLANLAPFLQGEVNLLCGVWEAMKDIKDEFERMSAFLRVADAKEESDPELKVWVKQVRDAAYDTEDVLDKFKLHLAHHHGDGFGEQGSRSNVVYNSWYDYRDNALLLEEAKLVGIEKPKRQLMEWLVEGGSGLKAVSVVGMGGLGKTTLVKKVYDDAKVKKHFKIHAWLTVSESFRVDDLLKDMIQQLFKEIMQPFPVGVKTMSIDRLKYLESWKLFYNKTFRGNLCPSYLKKISLQILERCEGLPLAILAISGVLPTKDMSKIDEWEMLYHNLGAELEGNDKLETKGFVNAIKGKTIKEVAKGYLNELFNRSLIQVAERYLDGRPSGFHIHDLMREIIVSKAREQNNVTTICKQGSRRPEKVRRLLIRSTSDNVEYIEHSSRLHSLFVWGPMDSLPIASLCELFRRGSRLLNVLDLKVKMVPKLIRKLENLETLNLARTYVTELPDEILQLQKLHNLILYHLKSRTVYLKFGDCNGFKAPSQIGRLQYLQVLWKIEADQRSEGGISIVKELGRLTQLRELSIGNLRREYGVTLCSSIKKLSNFRILYVISTQEDEILDLQWIPSLYGLGWTFGEVSALDTFSLRPCQFTVKVEQVKG